MALRYVLAVRRVSCALAIGLALTLLSFAPAAGAQATLEGEVFSDNPGEGTLTITAASCNPAGTSTFSYLATGPATGPFPGTFEESGTVVIGPQASPSGPGAILDFSATFAIDSPAGDVTGTKSLTGTTDILIDQGFCFTASPATGTIRAANIFSGVTYEALIQADTGNRRDRGTATVNVLEQQLEAFTASDFREAFDPTLPSGALRPGRGCGDRNHTHEREQECRAAPAR